MKKYRPVCFFDDTFYRFDRCHRLFLTSSPKEVTHSLRTAPDRSGRTLKNIPA
jgi:hypothetical protein